MRVRKTIRGVLCFGLAALLILGSEASASAAYQSSGGGRKNSFSLAAVLQFTATLTPKLEAGSGTETELCWFEQTENGT